MRNADNLNSELPSCSESPAEETATCRTASTLGDLAASEFFGMWRDRADIDDTPDFASRLRIGGWKR